MICEVEIGCTIFAVAVYCKYQVVVEELTQIFAPAVVVELEYVSVEPYMCTSERRASALLEGDFCHGEFCQQVAPRGTSLDGNSTEIDIPLHLFYLPRCLPERNPHHFRLTVGVSRKVHQT